MDRGHKHALTMQENFRRVHWDNLSLPHVREGATQLSPAFKDRTARELVKASLIYTLEAGDVWLSLTLYEAEMKYTSTHMSDACFSFHQKRANVPYVIVRFSIKNSVVSFV